MRECDHQLFAEAWHAIEQAPQMAAGNAKDARWSARDGRHDHRPSGEKIDVSGELARLVRRHEPIAVGRIQDVDQAGFDDAQIQIHLPGAKDGFAVGIVANGCQRREHRDFRGRQPGKRGFQSQIHCVPSIRTPHKTAQRKGAVPVLLGANLYCGLRKMGTVPGGFVRGSKANVSEGSRDRPASQFAPLCGGFTAGDTSTYHDSRLGKRPHLGM